MFFSFCFRFQLVHDWKLWQYYWGYFHLPTASPNAYFHLPKRKICLPWAIRPTMLSKSPWNTWQNSKWWHIILKREVIIKFAELPSPLKKFWNSGSTLDGLTSTLCWGSGGGGGQKDHMLGKVLSVPRLLTRIASFSCPANTSWLKQVLCIKVCVLTEDAKQKPRLRLNPDCYIWYL